MHRRHPAPAGLAVAAALALAAAAGLAAGVYAPTAAGLVPTDSLPVAPAPVPSVSLPAVPLPTTTSATTPPPTSGPAPGAPTQTTETTAPPPDNAPPSAGTIRLPSGAVSVPARGLAASALRIGRVRIMPTVVRRHGQRLRLVFRLRDSRGYAVRGARVAVRSQRTGWIDHLAGRVTRADGSATLLVRTTARLDLGRRGALRVIIRAQPRAAHAATTRLLSIPIAPR